MSRLFTPPILWTLQLATACAGASDSAAFCAYLGSHLEIMPLHLDGYQDEKSYVATFESLQIGMQIKIPGQHLMTFELGEGKRDGLYRDIIFTDGELTSAQLKRLVK